MSTPVEPDAAKKSKTKAKRQSGRQTPSTAHKKPVPALAPLAPSDAKREALAQAMQKINKRFGDGTVTTLDESARDAFAVTAVSTGIPALDLAIGAGGLPRGRMIELYGQEGGGKSAVAMHAVASFQRAGLTAAYLDLEQSFDPELASAYGVDLNSLILSQPGSGETAFDIAIALTSAGLDLVVVDSVAALAPQAELKGEMTDIQVGLQARLVSKACRILTPTANKDKFSRTTMIFINQYREKVGVMFGDPRTTPGGRALKHYASVRVEVASGAKADRVFSDDPTVGRVESGAVGVPQGADDAAAKGKVQIGQTVRMRVTKNKVGPPERTAEARLIWGVGFDRADQAYQLGVASGLLSVKGASHQVADGPQFIGKATMYRAFREDEELRESVITRSMERMAGQDLLVGGQDDSAAPDD